MLSRRAKPVPAPVVAQQRAGSWKHRIALIDRGASIRTLVEAHRRQPRSPRSAGQVCWRRKIEWLRVGCMGTGGVWGQANAEPAAGLVPLHTRGLRSGERTSQAAVPCEDYDPGSRRDRRVEAR